MAKIKRLPRNRKSLQRIRKRRDFFRRFGENFLQRRGYSSSDFSSSGLVKGRLGLFGGALASSAKQDSGADSGALPPISHTPQKVSNQSNPDISTIVKQLTALIKAADRIGAITEEQQEALLSQITKARRAAKEQLLERKDATQIESESSSGSDLSGFDPIISELMKSMSDLSSLVKKKVKDQEDDERGSFMENFMDRVGLGDQYKSDKLAKAEKLAKKWSPEKGLKGLSTADKRALRAQGFRQTANGRWTMPTGAGTGRTFASLNDVNRVVNKPGLISRGVQSLAATKTAGVIGKGFRTVATKTGVTGAGRGLKNIVQKAMGPLIAKAAGQGAARSIPVVGLGLNAFDAALRLIGGDTIGAGISALGAVGSFAGPIGALGPFAINLARDGYSMVYGMPPEQDPDVKNKMGALVNAIKELLAEQLSRIINPKQKPTSQAVDSQATAATAAQQQQVKAPPVAAPAKPAVAAPPKLAQAQTKAAPAKPAKSSSSPAPKPAKSAPKPVPSTPPATSGLAITEATESLESKLNEPTSQILSPGLKRPVPATSRTTRQGARGMGNVHDPNYYGMGNIPDRVYF